ncbi:MAG: SpoVT / AbrB like domain protein [Candidatus Bathyarchaeota archaeon BA1]|nr:MAG: SpoVT / AbrB like domain protein [Candidatus Bathyarchaeota archaeon BA1]
MQYEFLSIKYLFVIFYLFVGDVVSVEIGKYGRVVLPKELRDKYGVREGSRLIVRDCRGQIVLLPVRTYERPTEALHGSVRVEPPIEEPKDVARAHVRRRLVEELE